MKLAHNIANIFFPRESNNHKAKLLHPSFLLFLVLVLITYQFVLYALPKTGAKILGYAAQIDTSHIIELTNQKRNDAGLSPLTYNSQLENAAKTKAQHMLDNDYWAHVAPDGTEPWYFFSNVGYSYRYAGENLARDFSNASSTVDAWMASPSHRDNMLSTKYKEIGVAVVEGDLGGEEATIVVQLFGTQLIDTTPVNPIADASAQNTNISSPTPIPTSVPTVGPTAIPTLIPSPTLIPTVEPTTFFIAQAAPPDSDGMLPTEQSVSDRDTFEVLISPFNSTRNISMALITVLMSVLLIDAFIITRKNIRRLSGRLVAHVAFLGMILAIIIIARAGQIL